MAIIKVGDKATAPSVRPSLLLDFANSKSMDPRVTYTRSSTATYWDSREKVLADQNLTFPSQSFTTGGGSRVTYEGNNFLAPDGTNTASKYLETAANDFHDAYTHTFDAFGNTTISAYVKMIGRQYLYIYTTAGYSRVFDLVNGTVQSGYYSSSVQAGGAIESIGNGWFRISITFNQNSDDRQIAFGTVLTGGNFNSGFAGDVTKGFYLWGVQVEENTSMTQYAPTTDGPVQRYQSTLKTASVNVPRFDDNPATGESKGLLVEEGRTNIDAYSTSTSTGVTSYLFNWHINQVIAPDGTQTADVMRVDTSPNNYHEWYKLAGNADGLNYCFSIYAKPISGHNQICLRLGTAGTGQYAFYELTGNGSVSSIVDLDDAGIEYVGNGWYRIWAVETLLNDSSNWYYGVRLTDGNSDFTFDGDGFQSVAVWGRQVERGDFPTSYIATDGSSVTRSADDAFISNINTSDWFSIGGGTSFVEAAVGGFTTSQGFTSLYQDGFGNDWTGFYSNAPNGSAGNKTSVYTATSYENSYTTRGGQNGNTLGTGNYPPGVFTKLALSWSATQGTFAQDGFASTNTGNFRVVPYNVLNFTRLYQSGFPAKRTHIKKYAFYQGALDENEMIALTEE